MFYTNYRSVYTWNCFYLKELILSVTGSLYIFMGKVYKPGDRIEISGIKGDMIDVDSI